ncbi:P-loop NTPase [Halobacteriaceae archaeon GCM10025711]
MTEHSPTGLQDDVEAALREVRDRESGMNVFEAGLVEDIRVNDREVTVVADLADFRPEASDGVVSAMMHAVSAVDAVERAHVEQATPDANGRSSGVADIDRVVAVASAKGGVGKSTVAVNLACGLAADAAVGLFDADIHGPNVPSLLDVEGPVYSDDDGAPMPVDANGLEVMSVGLMEDGAPLAWRGAMAHDALTDLYQNTAWRDRDTLVIDLPPGTGDVVLTTLQEVRVDGVVFVTTPFHASVTDTQRSVELFRDNDVPVFGVVVNMESFACPSCGDVHDMFPGEDPLADLDVPVLADLPFSPALQGTPEPGTAPDAFVDLADDVAERWTEIWDVDVPDGAVDLRGVPAEERRDVVAEAFEELASGERFHVVSDRDPSPVHGLLVDIAGVEDDPGEAFDEFAVRQQNPETWFLRTRKP